MSFNISTKIEAWRSQLLDTTKRNRLINFKAGRSGGICLVHPDPGELWHQLVCHDETLIFTWKRDLIDLPPGSEQGTSEDLFAIATAEPDAASDSISEQDILEQCRHSPRLRPNHLLTNLSDNWLAKRLTRLSLNSRESENEHGVTILYLAFGFLRWFESPESKVEIRSPLLLVPVQLDRESIEAPWQLKADDEEILSNHSLIQLLKTDYRLALPAISEDSFNVDDPESRRSYFAAVEKSIRDYPQWEVLDEETALGTFNFQKLAMWEDLGSNQERIKDHDLCCAIAGDPLIALRTPSHLPEPEELDSKVHPQETYHILDADSSQQAAIVAAGQGANLILDGPPGTGKSQTIANIIAQFLASGKTVLFVSEKVAALEVVKRRLDAKRLGDFCLNLHSHKTNKREVIGELDRCLYLSPESSPNFSDDLKQLGEVRTRLNEYVRELHKIRQPLGLSVFQVHGELARLHQQSSKSQCTITQILNRDGSFLRRGAELLGQLRDCREVVEIQGPHPWRGCRKTAFTLTLHDDVQFHFSRLAQQLLEIMDICQELRKLGLVSDKATLADWRKALRNGRRAFTASWWDIETRQELQKALKQAMQCSQKAKGLYEELRVELSPEAFELARGEEIHNVKRYYPVWSWILPGWWRLKARSKTWFRRKPASKKEMLGYLEKLETYHHCLSLHGEIEARYQSEMLIDQSGKLDWGRTAHYLNSLDKLDEKEPRGRQVKALRNRLQELITRCDQILTNGFDESWIFLTELFDPAQKVSTGIVIEGSPLENLQPWLKSRIEDSNRIREWILFATIEHELKQLTLGSILPEVAERRVRLEEAGDAFLMRFLSLWRDAVFEQIPSLRQFNMDNPDRLIERFRELDRRSVESAVLRVRHLLLTRQDRPRSGLGEAPSSSELGILLKEKNKKRRHLPLRKFFEAIPNLLLRLKPCLMMSPLAVSTYLKSPDIKFDLVIFDEASQVRPHDAICAIYRGRQILVAGDQKQLPPTSFFERSLDMEEWAEEEPEDNLNDFESILDVCCTLGLMRRRLRWHYRSRREPLIAFSNRFYYDNELITFPSIRDTKDHPAISFDYVAEGFWKPGPGGGFNATEARRTAELVFDHFRKNAGQSLGVIAFSQRQQIRILDELEQLRRANPEREDFFREDRDEPFFVKNLENVQGDERDVIFLSIGYGPDETGRVRMNFGPLNRQGGERRLNVAVTRARLSMKVVSSLRAQDMDLSRTGAVGVRLLRAYLDYAERGTSALAAVITEDSGRSFDSPFEQEVYQELTRRNLTIHRQVGCSGFRIDLAVVDPREQGRYLLGIECDGATYHSFAAARDRDRLRQEVLESLGWRICRIWSTDWLRDRPGQIQRVLSGLEQVQRDKDTPPKPASAKNPPEQQHQDRTPNQTTSLSISQEFSDSRKFESINNVPERDLQKLILELLRSFGATAAEDLNKAVARRLGFSRTGNRIQARIDKMTKRLISQGLICPAADGRLQLSGNASARPS